MRQPPPLPELYDDRATHPCVGPRLGASAQQGLDHASSRRRVAWIARSPANVRRYWFARSRARESGAGPNVSASITLDRMTPTRDGRADPAPRRAPQRTARASGPGCRATTRRTRATRAPGGELRRSVHPERLERLVQERQRDLDIPLLGVRDGIALEHEHPGPHLVDRVAGVRRDLGEPRHDGSRHFVASREDERVREPDEDLELLARSPRASSAADWRSRRRLRHRPRRAPVPRPHRGPARPGGGGRGPRAGPAPHGTGTPARGGSRRSPPARRSARRPRPQASRRRRGGGSSGRPWGSRRRRHRG